MLRATVFAFSVLLFLGTFGCGGDDGVKLPDSLPVEGNVELDGKPLAEGEINFSIEGEPGQILPIKNGAYKGQAFPGQNRVEIYVYKTEKDDTTGEEMKINILPSQYNDQSTFTADVSKEGANKFDFKVTSK